MPAERALAALGEDRSVTAELTPEAAEAVAQGRVWIGADAHARGLVDELGDLETTRRLAEALAERRPETVAEGAVAPRRRSILSRVAVEMPASLSDALLLVGERSLLLAPLVSVD